MEFEPSPSTFEDLKAYLIDKKLIEIEGDQFRISDEERLKDLGFGIFLSFFYSNIHSNIPPKKAWQFVKLDVNHVLFIRSKEKNLVKIHNSHYIDDPFRGMPTGNLNCNLCPIKHWMLYNLCVLETEEEVKNLIVSEIEDFMSRDMERCYDCRRDIIRWLKEKIVTKEVYGKLLGGDVCLLDVKSDFFKFFYSTFPEKIESYKEDSKIDKEVNLEEPVLAETKGGEVVKDELGKLDPIEVLFNSFLVMYLAGKTGYPIIGANAKMRKPFEAHELDGYLWDPEKKRLIVIETSREMRIDRNHLKHKIYNSVLMDLLEHSTYNYIYITLGNKSRDFRENTGHVKLVKNLKGQYNVPFTIIDLPQKYDRAKKNFDSKLLKEIYNHYITSIEKQLKLGSKNAT
ncbi:hypothetical protein [Candidatus Pyrohabitans sp.]